MHPGEQYMNKYLDLYTHIEDKCYVERTERFERWYENPVDLPGRWYLQAIEQLFKENRLAKRVRRTRTPNLAERHHVPLYLLAGEEDDITTKEQVFNTAKLVGTPATAIVSRVAPGGHLGLFMGSRTLQQVWPEIAAWIKHQEPVEVGRNG